MSDRISAGELRSKGWTLPDNIPDCATIPAHALVPVPESLTVALGESGIYRFGVNAVVTAPFEWVEGTFKIEE